MKKPFISAIVPCYNEEMWAAKGIKGLLSCPVVDEIIVVNDGSTDKTLQILNRFKNQIKIISYKKNKGKGFAMAAGIRKAQGKIIFFMDAHHLNVKNSHIIALTNPLIENRADAVLGTTESHPGDFCWRFTGFRAYWKKDLLPYLPKIEKTRFGVEIYLNELFKKKRKKVIIPKGLVHLAKHQKMPLSQIPSASVNQVIEMGTTLMEARGIPTEKIRQVFDPEKTKTIKALKSTINKIKDQEVFSLLKKYLLDYLNE